MQKLGKHIQHKHMVDFEYTEINPKIMKELLNKLDTIIKNFSSYELCTQSCLKLDYIAVLLKFSAYRNLEKADKQEEFLKKCLKSGELTCEEFLKWCDDMILECQQVQHVNHKKQSAKIITEKPSEVKSVKLSLTRGTYKQGVSPDPIICIAIAHITRCYQGDHRVLAKFFVDIRDFLQKINSHVNKKINYIERDEFVFIDFANCYGWSIDVIDKSVAQHDKANLMTIANTTELSKIL